MEQRDTLSRRLDSILSGRNLGAQAHEDVQAQRHRRAVASSGTIDAALAAQGSTAVLQRSFSSFILADVNQAVALASRLMQIVDRNGGEAGLAEAVEESERALSTAPPGLVEHAIKLFLTHHPEARTAFPMQPLEQRQPFLACGSSRSGGGATPPENRLDFWREDPLVNEHHEHWHLVYPISGRPSSTGGGYALGDRHGELFAYMHQQMLARYDAERLAVGLPRVVPFSDYRAPIPQGYDPGALGYQGQTKAYSADTPAKPQWLGYRARPAGASINDLTGEYSTTPGATLSDMEAFRQRLLEATRSGVFQLHGSHIVVDASNLGNTMEANINSVDYYGLVQQDAGVEPHPNNYKLYGNLHLDGHFHFMLFDNQPPYGVMAAANTAPRDPIFFRWHKEIDNIKCTWQNARAPYDFSDAPPVKFRKALAPAGGAVSPDIILCLKDGLPVGFDGEPLGRLAFGYSEDPMTNNWDLDCTATRLTLPDGKEVTTTDELLTEMQQRTISLTDDQGNSRQESIDYLSHDDFYYFIRVENRSDRPQKITVRIFLAPETEIEDRSSWIEMDKFLYQLRGAERAVIFRPADLASVIRKPALRPVDLPASPARDQQEWCDCGWAYTLLLPRGTREGMAFRLCVICSSGDDLTLPAHAENCTSISYCGLQDQAYPDKRPMGYPFDRPFPHGISSTFLRDEHMTSRTITIRCKNL